MNILVVDVGGTHVKILATGQIDERKINSGPKMTAAAMVAAVKTTAAGWAYEVVSLGFPGPVVHEAPFQEPVNLGSGWVGFDFAQAFGCPVRVINDAAMQALGSYEGGRMLFLGLGTGLGSAMIVNGIVQPMELAHLPYKHGKTYEDFVGLRGLERLGKKEWRREVSLVVHELAVGLEPDYVVLGGGNTRVLKELPPNCRLGNNANAFLGGFRLWAAPSPSNGQTPPPSAEVQGPTQVAAERCVVDSELELGQRAASELVKQAQAAVAAHGLFCLALSGGTTPLGLYRLLATDPDWRSQVPWDQTYFFWGDERHVGPESEESNYRGANEALLAVIPVPADHVFRVPAEMAEAAAAASAYEATLKEFFHLEEGALPRFDLILLGLGTEGHTASLFPGTSALAEQKRLVVSNWVGKLYAHRITLTAPVLNNAACIMFLATGAAKAPALKAILEGPYEPQQLPAQLVRPTHGRLLWLLDRDAASDLRRP